LMMSDRLEREQGEERKDADVPYACELQQRHGRGGDPERLQAQTPST
jgi:hypothetical protein